MVDKNIQISIMIDYDGPGCLNVYPNPEADHIMACPPRPKDGSDYCFSRKAEAEKWAEKEANRLRKLGYTNVDWCTNY